MKSKVYLAIDLGASSGRVMAGRFDGRQLILEEVHRFPNGGHLINGHFYWNFVGLFTEIKAGLTKAAATYGRSIASLGVDTWGVDYGLLDISGCLLGMPFQYRDARTDGMMARTFRRMPKRQVYETTGIQFMFFNSLFQLMAEQSSRGPALAAASKLLFAPDLINFWLSGKAVNEYTISSTSQLLDARTRRWSKALIRKVGLPERIFGPIVQPGTVLGGLTREVCAETGLGAIKVVAPGCHDTASAVAAVPASGKDFVYLSSGTWSLMGVETKQPVITDKSFAYGFTNEGGVCGTIRLLKNICGLWLIQECRRIWAQQGKKLEFEDLRKEAMASRPFAALINPDDPVFSTPGDMPARIAAFCRRTGQQAPATPGAIVRAIYESLALRYRDVFEKLEDLTGRRHDVLHVVGGGSRDVVLNQFTADALQRFVVAGPVEATAVGNILMQMIATRAIRSLDQGRELVGQSFPVTSFKPGASEPWEEANARFRKLVR
jgi:rhamnulokinase